MRATLLCAVEIADARTLVQIARVVEERQVPGALDALLARMAILPPADRWARMEFVRWRPPRTTPRHRFSAQRAWRA